MIGAYIRGSLSAAKQIRPHARLTPERGSLTESCFHRMGWVRQDRVARAFRLNHLFFSRAEGLLIGYYSAPEIFVTSQDTLLAQKWNADQSMPAVVTHPNFADIKWQGVLPPKDRTCEVRVEFNDIANPFFIGGTLLHANMTDEEARDLNFDLRLLEELKRLVA